MNVRKKFVVTMSGDGKRSVAEWPKLPRPILNSTPAPDVPD